MKYIITGATSFIGSKFVKALLHEENIVYAIVRPNSSRISALDSHDNLHIISEDFNRIRNISDVIPEADIFVNFAWEGSSHKDRNVDSINERNIQNTISAMRCAKDKGCVLFVEMGSQAEYGYHNDLISEHTECNPYSAYGKAKLQTFQKCKKLAKELNIAYLHFRIFSVYGEDDHDYTLFKTCLNNMQNNNPIELSDGTQNWNFLYVDDAVAIMQEIIKKSAAFIEPGHTEIINIASKDTRKLREYISQMKLTLNSKSELRFGSVKVDKLLSLNPDISKMLSIIGKDYQIMDFKQGVILSLNRNNVTGK